MFKQKKSRYYAKIMKRIGNGYKVLKTVKLKIEQKNLKITKDKEYPIDFEKYAFQDGLNFYYLFNVDKGQVTVDAVEEGKMRPEIYKKIVKDALASQLIHQEVKKFDWITFLMGLGVGGGVLFSIGLIVGGI